MAPEKWNEPDLGNENGALICMKSRYSSRQRVAANACEHVPNRNILVEPPMNHKNRNVSGPQVQHGCQRGSYFGFAKLVSRIDRDPIDLVAKL